MEFIKPCINCLIYLPNLSKEIADNIIKDCGLSKDTTSVELSEAELEKYDIKEFDLTYGTFLLNVEVDTEALKNSLIEYVGSYSQYLVATVSCNGYIDGYGRHYEIVDTLSIIDDFENDEFISLDLIRSVDDKAIYCKKTCFRTGISQNIWIIGLSQEESNTIDEIEYCENELFDDVEEFIEHIIDNF